MEDFFDESDLAEDVSTADIYETVKPAKREFSPWHLPRKQFVRDKQWSEQILRLLDSSQRNSEIFRYLGLPGSDLLDLRYFHDKILQPKNLRLKFLGFIREMSDSQLITSMDEISKFSQFEPGSDLLPDDFKIVANDRSVAWARTVSLGPYDVINLDLCNSFALEQPNVFDTTNYEAVLKILTLQARKQEPWLFLLTTRVGERHSHSDVITSLKNEYRSNLENCPDFKQFSQANFSISNEVELEAQLATSTGHLLIFIVGISKWLLRNAAQQRPQTKVELKSVIGYKVFSGAECEDLVSIALKFEPMLNAPADPIGLSMTAANLIDECQLAVPILNRVLRRIDADKVLADNATVNQAMIQATIELLNQARYDTSGYEAWVTDFQSSSSRD